MTPQQEPSELNPLRDPRRRRSEELAAEAEGAWRQGDHDRARKLFAAAAAIEEAVARDAPPTMPRARSAVAIAATALWQRAGDFATAKLVAYWFLGQPTGLTDEGRQDLERLVERCAREAELMRMNADPGMVPVEVKLQGGRVGVGVAPEGAARRRREMLASLLRRTAELEAKVDYRDRGESELERNEEIQLLEVPALAASYGVRLYVATGMQQRIASEQKVTPSRVVERFLELAEAAATGPEAIRAAVSDPQYANAFLDGFAEIAPDGEDVTAVTCSAPTWRIRTRSLVFEPEHRRVLRAAVSPVLRDAHPGEKIFEGKLASVHLTRSSSWIELEVPSREEPEIIMVNDKRLRAKVATLRSGENDALVRVYAKRSPRQQRMAMTDVVALARGRGGLVE
jgi:hypothetical protein